jgi:hypothetical protein
MNLRATPQFIGLEWKTCGGYGANGVLGSEKSLAVAQRYAVARVCSRLVTTLLPSLSQSTELPTVLLPCA